jgi:hypothetical protein
VSVPDVREDSGPERPRVPGEAAFPDAAEEPQYSRPQAFSVGRAVRLVRGGFYGKSSDGYTGYYTEV